MDLQKTIAILLTFMAHIIVEVNAYKLHLGDEKNFSNFIDKIY